MKDRVYEYILYALHTSVGIGEIEMQVYVLVTIVYIRFFCPIDGWII